MSMLSTLLYGQQPHPIPTQARLHTYALPDEKQEDFRFPRTSKIECVSCLGKRDPDEMHVKQDGTLGKHCKKCTERNNERIRRHATR